MKRCASRIVQTEIDLGDGYQHNDYFPFDFSCELNNHHKEAHQKSFTTTSGQTGKVIWEGQGQFK